MQCLVLIGIKLCLIIYTLSHQTQASKHSAVMTILKFALSVLTAEFGLSPNKVFVQGV